MKKKIYTATSVIGGCLDTEFEQGSLALFEAFSSGATIIVVSNLTLAELEAALSTVQEVLKKVPRQFIEYIEFTEEAGDLSKTHLEMEWLVRYLHFVCCFFCPFQTQQKTPFPDFSRKGVL